MTATFTLADTYSLSGTTPNGVAFSPDGNYIVVAIESGDILLFDHTTPGTLVLVDTYTLATGRGTGVAFSPDGNYVGVATNGDYVLLDHTTPGSLSLAATLALAGPQLSTAFTPDGNYIAVGHQVSPYFSLLDHTTPGSLSLADTYTLPGQGQGVAVSPDSSYIAVAHAGSPYFTLLNQAAGVLSLADTYTLPGVGVSASFRPDGNFIAVGHGTGPFLTVLDHRTPGTVTLGATQGLNAVPYGVPYDPDGHFIVELGSDPELGAVEQLSASMLASGGGYSLQGNGPTFSNPLAIDPSGLYVVASNLVSGSPGTGMVTLLGSDFVPSTTPVPTTGDINYLSEVNPDTVTQQAGPEVTKVTGGGQSARSIMTFDLTGLSGTPVAAVLKMTSRAVTVFGGSGVVTGQVIAVHDLVGTYVGTEATWNDKSTGVPWSAPGGDYGLAKATYTFLDSVNGATDEVDVFDLIDFGVDTQAAFILKWDDEATVVGSFDDVQWADATLVVTIPTNTPAGATFSIASVAAHHLLLT